MITEKNQILQDLLVTDQVREEFVQEQLQNEIQKIMRKEAFDPLNTFPKPPEISDLIEPQTTGYQRGRKTLAVLISAIIIILTLNESVVPMPVVT